LRKLTYYIACSLDGFIGDPGGDASSMYSFVDGEFLEYLRTEYPETLPTHGRRALGIDHLENRRFDTIIQGRASYELALKEGITSPYAHLREYVASRTLSTCAAARASRANCSTRSTNSSSRPTRSCWARACRCSAPGSR
jgi:hypothetical protein